MEARDVNLAVPDQRNEGRCDGLFLDRRRHGAHRLRARVHLQTAAPPVLGNRLLPDRGNGFHGWVLVREHDWRRQQHAVQQQTDANG